MNKNDAIIYTVYAVYCFIKHVFPTFSSNAKISISSYDISSCEILILLYLEKVGNTCLTRTKRVVFTKVGNDKGKIRKTDK